MAVIAGVCTNLRCGSFTAIRIDERGNENDSLLWHHRRSQTYRRDPGRHRSATRARSGAPASEDPTITPAKHRSPTSRRIARSIRKNSDRGSRRASSNTSAWATSCSVTQFSKPPPARSCGGHCALRMPSAGRTSDTEVAAVHAPSRPPGRRRSAARAARAALDRFQLYPFDDRPLSTKGPLSRVG
jgi:hypothetical protein